jgi:hypothetical protein
MSNTHKKHVRNALARLGNATVDLTGATIGTATGFAIGGPEGAMAGSALGVMATHTLRDLGADLMQRVLSPNQERRVGEALDVAITRIEANLTQGLHLRQDNFFYKSVDDRSFADEIAEGVMLAAKDEHEEKKVKYYGNLLGNLAFREDIDRTLANLLLRLAHARSYRQLCYIAMLPRKYRYGLGFSEGEMAAHFGEASLVSLAADKLPYIALAADVQELRQAGLVHMPNAQHIGSLTELGMLLYTLMSLAELDEHDFLPIRDLVVPEQWRDVCGMPARIHTIVEGHLTNFTWHILIKQQDGYLMDNVLLSVCPGPLSDYIGSEFMGPHVVLESETGVKYVVSEGVVAKLTQACE